MDSSRECMFRVVTQMRSQFKAIVSTLSAVNPTQSEVYFVLDSTGMKCHHQRVVHQVAMKNMFIPRDKFTEYFLTGERIEFCIDSKALHAAIDKSMYPNECSVTISMDKGDSSVKLKLAKENFSTVTKLITIDIVGTNWKQFEIPHPDEVRLTAVNNSKRYVDAMLNSKHLVLVLNSHTTGNNQQPTGIKIEVSKTDDMGVPLCGMSFVSDILMGGQVVNEIKGPVESISSDKGIVVDGNRRIQNPGYGGESNQMIRFLSMNLKDSGSISMAVSRSTMHSIASKAASISGYVRVVILEDLYIILYYTGEMGSFSFAQFPYRANKSLKSYE